MYIHYTSAETYLSFHVAEARKVFHSWIHWISNTSNFEEIFYVCFKYTFIIIKTEGHVPMLCLPNNVSNSYNLWKEASLSQRDAYSIKLTLLVSGEADIETI